MPVFDAATSDERSGAIDSERSGVSPHGASSREHAFADRSQTRTMPDWSAEINSVWFGCSATELIDARGSVWYERCAAGARRSHNLTLPSSLHENSQRPSFCQPSAVTLAL